MLWDELHLQLASDVCSRMLTYAHSSKVSIYAHVCSLAFSEQHDPAVSSDNALGGEFFYYFTCIVRALLVL